MIFRTSFERGRNNRRDGLPIDQIPSSCDMDYFEAGWQYQHNKMKASADKAIFDAGMKASKNGEQRMSNPHDPKTKSYSVWNQGFDTAQFI